MPPLASHPIGSESATPPRPRRRRARLGGQRLLEQRPLYPALRLFITARPKGRSEPSDRVSALPATQSLNLNFRGARDLRTMVTSSVSRLGHSLTIRAACAAPKKKRGGARSDRSARPDARHAKMSRKARNCAREQPSRSTCDERKRRSASRQPRHTQAMRARSSEPRGVWKVRPNRLLDTGHAAKARGARRLLGKFSVPLFIWPLAAAP